MKPLARSAGVADPLTGWANAITSSSRSENPMEPTDPATVFEIWGAFLTLAGAFLIGGGVALAEAIKAVRRYGNRRKRGTGWTART